MPICCVPSSVVACVAWRVRGAVCRRVIATIAVAASCRRFTPIGRRSAPPATSRQSRWTRWLDALVWEDLCRLLNEPEAIRFALEWAHGGHWLPQDLQARRQALRRGQASVQQQMERLTEADLASLVSLEEYRRRRLDLEQKAQSLAAQVQQLEGQVDRQGEVARVGLSMEEFCRRVREGLDQATWEQKRQLIEWLVVRVIVTDGEVEIRYAIPTSPAGEGTRFCQLRADYRAALGKAQGVARYRNPLRENRLKLHGCPLSRRHTRLAQALTGPSSHRVSSTGFVVALPRMKRLQSRKEPRRGRRSSGGDA